MKKYLKNLEFRSGRKISEDKEWIAVLLLRYVHQVVKNAPEERRSNRIRSCFSTDRAHTYIKNKYWKYFENHVWSPNTLQSKYFSPVAGSKIFSYVEISYLYLLWRSLKFLHKNMWYLFPEFLFMHIIPPLQNNLSDFHFDLVIEKFLRTI